MSDATVDTIHRTAGTFIATLEVGRLGDSTLVAAVEQLETASVDPTTLIGDQTLGLRILRRRDCCDRNDAALFTPGATPPPVPYVAPPAPEMFGLVDTTISSAYQAYSTSYTGPVAGLQNQFVELGPDNVNITATQPNNFICGGPGDDAIDVSAVGGTNVLDGGGGSNFLTGGSGLDTFFVAPDHRFRRQHRRHPLHVHPRQRLTPPAPPPRHGGQQHEDDQSLGR